MSNRGTILFNTKAWKYIESILVVLLLAFCIKSITDYDNRIYQTLKDQVAANALLALSALAFILRKVKLLNWQSLVGSIVMLLISIERTFYYINSQDILKGVLPRLVTEWLVLMIIIDMILYKKVNDLFRRPNALLILYALMTFGMLYRRNGSIYTYILVFPLFIFSLIRIEYERKLWLMKRFIDAWFITFIYVCLRSFIENPYDGGRYYGYFTTLGPFGMFMACNMTVAIFALLFSKEEYGYKSFFFISSIVWIVLIAGMLWLIDTRTSLLGIVFCLVFVYLFVRKDTNRRVLTIRMIKIVSLVVILVGLMILAIFTCLRIPLDWIIDHDGSLLSPIIHRLIVFRNIAKMDADIPFGERIYIIIDTLSSWRLSIIRRYAEDFNYYGNGHVTYNLDAYNNYYAYHAHNTYVQFISAYGYVSFVEMLGVVGMSIVKCVRGYLKSEHKKLYLLPMLWLASMVGMWITETALFFYPITFWGLVFIVMLIPQTE